MNERERTRDLERRWAAALPERDISAASDAAELRPTGQTAAARSGRTTAESKAQLREIRRLTRSPEGCSSTFHPMLLTLTPRGRKKVRRQQARNRVAKQSRKVNRLYRASGGLR